MIQKFFEIFNFRFWILLAELLYFPVGIIVGCLIAMWKQRKEDEVQ